MDQETPDELVGRQERDDFCGVRVVPYWQAV
jgi:hypothetical protein